MPGKVFTYKKGSAVVRIARTDKKRTVSDKKKFIAAVIHEVSGLSPYERHIIELLKLGKDRLALRFAKKRLGNIKRAKGKVEQLVPYSKGN